MNAGIVQLSLTALLAATVSSLLTTQMMDVRAAAPAPILTVRELVLVNESSVPVAKLSSVKGHNTMAFLGPDGKEKVAIGMDFKTAQEFVTLMEKSGPRITASLTSGAPNSGGTLALGDRFWSGRVMLGAMPSDVDRVAGSSDDQEWGLQFSRTLEQSPIISIAVPSRSSIAKPGIGIKRADNSYWTAP
jgi:hypothetical protein